GSDRRRVSRNRRLRRRGRHPPHVERRRRGTSEGVKETAERTYRSPCITVGVQGGQALLTRNDTRRPRRRLCRVRQSYPAHNQPTSLTGQAPGESRPCHRAIRRLSAPV